MDPDPESALPLASLSALRIRIRIKEAKIAENIVKKYRYLRFNKNLISKSKDIGTDFVQNKNLKVTKTKSNFFHINFVFEKFLSFR